MSSEALNQRFIHVPFRAIVASICLHLLLLVAFVTVKVLDYLGIHLFSRKPLQVYQNFIQVDVVGLPDELINEKKNVDTMLPIVDKPRAVPEPAPETQKDEPKSPSEDDIMAEKRKIEKQKKLEEEKKVAREKKEREKALKKLQEEASREAALKALARAREGKTGRAKIAGNLLSKGTAMVGMIGNAKDRYQSLVAQKIREHFKIYQWQRKKGLVSVVTIDLLPNGRVRQKRLIRASSDPLYNTAVLQAIDEAQPLPLPEDKALIADGITIEFSP